MIKIYKPSSIFMIVFCFFVLSLFSTQGFAGDNQEKLCDVFNSVFVPSPNEGGGSWSYELRIKKNEDYKLGQNAKYFFEFSLLDKANLKLVASIVVDYKCFLGDSPRCYLELSENNNLDLLGLDHAFNPIFSYKHGPPYSIVIPRAGSAFKDKYQIKKIKFYTSEQVMPPLGFPTVWLNKTCK